MGHGGQQNNLQNQNFQQLQNRTQYRSKVTSAEINKQTKNAFQQPENASNYRPRCFNPNNNFTQ
jgi:hypothetical protein